MQQLAANQVNAHVPVNENFATLRWAEVYGNDPDIISALHRGYLGGRWGSFDFTAVDHTFGASTTTYVSVDRSDGTLDFSTSSTNYLDTTNYATVETVVTGASSITSVIDDRGGPGGVHGGGGSVGGSGGTVTHTAGALTANAVVLGAGTDDAKVVAGISTDGASALNLGVAGSSVGKVVLANATSGTITVQPPTGALGMVTLTMPAATDTLVGKATTDTLTNKTLTNAIVGTQSPGDNSTKAASTAYVDDAVAAVGGGGLTNFTDGLNSSAPNATIPVASLTATNAATHVDAAIVPKGGNAGSGSFMLAVPDNAATGGNKRGARAIDLQIARAAASNVASGNESFAAGARNTAGGANSVAIGQNNNASTSDCVAIGAGNLPSGANAVAIGGTNTSSGSGSVAIGNNAVASNTYAFAMGYYATASGVYSRATSLCIASGTFGYAHGYAALDRGMYGAEAFASGYFAGDGDSQVRRAVLRIGTTNATQATATADGTAATTVNQLVLPNNGSVTVKGVIQGRQNATGDAASWEFTAHIKRGANAAATAMVAACTPVVIAADAGASAWAVAVDADTTNGCLRIRVTGEAAKTIRWNCCVEALEVTG